MLVTYRGAETNIFVGPLSFLDLEQIGDDRYRGCGETWPDVRSTIYGGQVAAQALLAAAYTVPEGRRPHSLHGYFLRGGALTKDVVFHVDRDRDGRSFTARRIVAEQDGEAIFEMSCSFHVDEGGAEFVQPMLAGVREPHELRPLTDGVWHPLLDIRVPPPPGADTPKGMSLDRMWLKSSVPLPDDPVVHACVLTFFSDVTAGFGDMEVPGIPIFGPSIDHALWFHGSPRADRWALWNNTPLKVGGQRGLYLGTAHDEDGTLIAMMTQEMLLRASAPLPNDPDGLFARGS